MARQHCSTRHAGTYPTHQPLCVRICTTALPHMRTSLLTPGLPRSAMCMQRSKRVSTTQQTSPSPIAPIHMRIPKHNIGCMVVRHVWNQVHIPCQPTLPSQDHSQALSVLAIAFTHAHALSLVCTSLRQARPIPLIPHPHSNSPETRHTGRRHEAAAATPAARHLQH
jgi:hypothetical protein